MSDSDILMGLTAPVTVLALQAGAVALDDNPKLRAENEGLKFSLDETAARLAAALQRIAELEALLPQPARFPGDPGPGKVIVGLATTGQNLTQVKAREKTVGMGLAFRQYNNAGISDLAVPHGPLCAKVKRDHAEGRMSVISPKPGMAALAAHKFGPELEKFCAWLEAQPGYTALIGHHEPENDPGFDAAVFAEGQRWVRTCLDKAAGGKPKRTIFLGSLMTYSWTAQGKAKFGDPNLMDPGKLPDGRHVWDMCGADHYEPSYTAASLDTKKWRDFLASCKAWGVLPAVTENALNNGNVGAGPVLAAFLAKYGPELGMYLYFDSHAGAGGKPQPDPRDWWDLTDANGTLQAFTDFARQFGANPNATTGA